jgi:hypothetical protein
MVRIISNGSTPESIKVTDEKGNELKHIRSIDIRIRPKELISAEIGVYAHNIDLNVQETFKAFFDLNVNEKVSVKLTENGLEFLKEYSEDMDLMLNTNNTFEYYQQYLNGDILTMQLWEIMNIFGSSFILGSPPPFTDIAFEKTT